MITVSENKQYKIEVDIPRNRAFLTVKGFWRNAAEIPAYLDDWDQAIGMLKPGFTLLTDVTEMTIHPGEVRDIHLKAQKKIIDAGVKRVAELQKAKVAELQLNGVAQDSGMSKKNFNSREEAVAWLESA